MYIDLHVKYTVFLLYFIIMYEKGWACFLFLDPQDEVGCYILNKRKFSRQIFEDISNIKFHKNSSSAGRVVSCGQTDRQTRQN